MTLPAGASVSGRGAAVPGTGHLPGLTSADCSSTQADRWLGGSGEWDSSNWSTGAPPSGTALACITVPGSSVTVSDIDTGPNDLVLGGSSGAAVTLTIVSSDTVESDLSVTADSAIEPTGVLSLASASDPSTDVATFSVRTPATLDNSGLIKTSGDSAFLQGSITNEKSGTVTLDGVTSTNSGDIVNNGAWTIGTAGDMEFDPTSFKQAGGTLDNHGTIGIDTGSGGEFTMSGGKEEGNPVELIGTPFKDEAGSGSFKLTGSESISGVIPAGQTVTCVSTATSETSIDIDSPGVTIDKTGKLVLDVTSAGSTDDLVGSRLTNNGTIEVEAVGTGATIETPVTNSAGATVEASGTGFVMNNTLTNNGLLTLGKGTDMELNGFTLTEGSGATLGVNVGTAKGTTSKITDSEASTTKLNGTVKVTTDGTIKAGDKFEVIDLQQTGSAVSGKFSKISSSKGTYSASYAKTSVTLKVVTA